MSLALTAARAALLRKEASAGKIALGLGALGAAGLGTAAGLGAFAKAPPAEGFEPPDPVAAGPARRVPLRQRLQQKVTGTVVGDVLSRMHNRYAGGGQ